MSSTVEPGATIGVVGGGQLGRMMALAAARLGFRVRVLAPETDAPAAQVSAEHVCAQYEDPAGLERFARGLAAATYEFENLPLGAMAALAERVPLRPSPSVLAIAQHRIREKEFLQRHGIPVTPFRPVFCSEELPAAAAALGGRVVVKTSEWGYDGKGQTLYDGGEDPAAAWRRLSPRGPCIAERLIDLAGECSVIAARDVRGQLVLLGPFRNVHSRHILDTTTWSANDHSPEAATAREIARAAAEALDLTGLLCVEMFIATDGSIMVNELAPRPHNSGHLTIEALSISQFELQARLTAGWPAVEPLPRAPAAAMANLLGDLWAAGEPLWRRVLDDPAVTLHLYGKREPRPGRKMGHLTVLADTPTEALRRVVEVRRALVPRQ
ncbi:MAG: 5-(carboxyamino)imidazole ribonucleotide synthase [Kiritimatiellae bacterium]|nr:5-(carboxyamino)imidazole ribonucleotide synthase [Kiritimatiellia bacterium]